MSVWLTRIQELEEKGEITIKCSGNSMTPRIKDLEPITITSDCSDLKKGDIVFCKVNGRFFVHLITAIRGKQFQISNNHGHVNGWTNKVYGKVKDKQKGNNYGRNME